MEKRFALKKKARMILLGGLLISLVSLVSVASMASASSTVAVIQSAGTPTLGTPAAGTSTAEITTATATVPPKACVECHPDKKNAWMDSPHAHAADNPIFLEGWENMERSTDCLLCHKASYDPQTGDYTAAGVSCETCHGTVTGAHPPEEVPARSDEEYCGTCHPTTLGEARLSGHSTGNEVRCVDCHDPHSQKVLFKNPNDMCTDCHREDLEKMNETLGQVHLQNDISCADCHMLDVPHTFVFNFQHEDTTTFFKGFDCTSEITANVAKRTGTDHEVLGSYVKDQMNWPVVHRVSRLESAPQCSDCHIMDQKLKADFVALGFSQEDVDKLSWEGDEYPALTENDLNKIVAKPTHNWSWVYWLLGVVVVFGIFEFTVARKIGEHPHKEGQTNLLSVFRARFTRKNSKKDKGKE